MLFPDGVDRFHGFADAVEGCISVAADRGAVRRALGAPTRPGGTGQPIGVLVDRFWDRYDFPRYSLRFDYEGQDGMIHHVTVMTSECARELNADMRERSAAAEQGDEADER